MTLTNNCRLLLSSLSVYKKVLNTNIVQTFYKLLNSMDKEPDDFLNAYGSFFSTLSEKGYENNFSTAITKTILYDENSFTKTACKKDINANNIPENIKKGVLHDCKSILAASKIDSNIIFKEYKYAEKIQGILNTLPKWEITKPIKELNNLDSIIESLLLFHENNGCGIFAKYKAFTWTDSKLVPVKHLDDINIESLTGYENERNIVLNNTKAFLNNNPANNCLLYGDKGTGKSTTVKAVFNKLKNNGLRIIEMPKKGLKDFSILVNKIASIPMKFIVFVDDLSFHKDDESYAPLKALLEGSLTAKPDNTLIYATSNRRHLVQESFEDNKNYSDLHPNDSKEENLSLYDRFGLTVCFIAPNRKEYFEIVKSLARQSNINIDDTLLENAEIFALGRGGRSPRCAIQYINSLFN